MARGLIPYGTSDWQGSGQPRGRLQGDDAVERILVVTHLPWPSWQAALGER